MKSARETLKAFYEGYQTRKLEEIDAFMTLFSQSEDVEMMGIGATEPGAYEWFKGFEAIKEIIISDWTYWGNVTFEVDNAHIYENGDMAFFTTYGTLTQNTDNSASMPFFKNQMKELLEKEEDASDQMFEAVHFGIRRLLEQRRGIGAEYKLVISGALVKEEIWRFIMLHWSMPVD
ncbi:MAG: nuclear transport factor 2 family protein [Clostridia bacterium]|nr:nuclear transport factor 2 family protein [Clostridia bacterium]